MNSFILNDERVVNNQGFRIMTEGIDLSQMLKNPVMYLAHKEDLLPIGKWTNIRKEGPLVLADPIYDEEDDDPIVKRAISKAKRGYINMASMGAWPPTGVSAKKEDMLPGQKLPTVTKCVMREASICGIGANNGAMAVRLYDIDGNLTDAIKLSDSFKINNSKTVKTMSLNKILKLADGAADEVVEAAVIALVDKAKELETENAMLKGENVKLADEVAQNKKAGIIALVDAAIADKKIGADMKDTYIKLAEGNYDDTKAILDKMPKVTNPANEIENGTEGFKLSDTEKAWKYADWDKAGRAIELRDKAPDLFKTLYKAEYGVDYNG